MHQASCKDLHMQLEYFSTSDLPLQQSLPMELYMNT